MESLHSTVVVIYLVLFFFQNLKMIDFLKDIKDDIEELKKCNKRKN